MSTRHGFLLSHVLMLLSISTADMNRPKTDCRELIETTTALLDDENLRQRYESVQRNPNSMSQHYILHGECCQCIPSISLTHLSSSARAFDSMAGGAFAESY